MRRRRDLSSPVCWAHEVRGSERAGPATIRIKRIYDAPARGDGFRVLVDRLWPRGIRKDGARIDAWARELAPSSALRIWFAHDPARWREFGTRYRAELRERVAYLEGLRTQAARRPVTLLYAARDAEHNHAIVLKEVLEKT